MTATTLKLSNFDSNTTLEFGSGQNLTVTKAFVKICALGTNGQPEWLDQGLSVVSVAGNLTSTTPATYTLKLGVVGTPANTYASPGACTLGNQRAKTYSYTSSAVITNSANATTPLTSTYNFWNVANLVPVPATIILLLTGLLGLGWMSAKRKRQMQAQRAKI